MESGKYVVIDFDSTFMQVEALEELADIALKGSPAKQKILDEIKKITDLGVDGKISFNDSLSRRLALFELNKEHVDKLVRRLRRKVSVSFSRNKAFFKKYRGRIFIISNGFKDFIDPVVKPYHIDSAHVLANTFIYNKKGVVTGFDQANLLAHSNGKSRSLKEMALDGEIHVIGDAYTDYEMIEAGIAHKFYMFTENVFRESILEKADHVTPSFDEFLYVNNMPMAISYPKNRIKVLLSEEVHEDAKVVFENEGYQVAHEKFSNQKELKEFLNGTTILGIGPGSKITENVLRNAKRLMAIGVFGVGTSMVDLEACSKRGIVVFNAPYNHTRSQAELAIAEIIVLLRRTPVFSRQMHKGQWMKTTERSYEARGKKLGIVGYGNAGKQLSVLAEAVGMDVHYYDIAERQALGNATRCSNLRELLRKADVVSIHVDNRAENDGFFKNQQFNWMRAGSIFLNLSNGRAVDLEALAKHLKSGKLRGAAIDVFPQEPRKQSGRFRSELMNLENVILTPHIAGHTEEAWTSTASFVPSHIIDYVNTGNTFGSVNFPELQLPAFKDAHRLLHIHENIPGILARINNIFAAHKINILGQYLQTTSHFGYVITDIDKVYAGDVLDELKGIEHTIKFRVLY